MTVLRTGYALDPMHAVSVHCSVCDGMRTPLTSFAPADYPQRVQAKRPREHWFRTASVDFVHVGCVSQLARGLPAYRHRVTSPLVSALKSFERIDTIDGAPTAIKS